MGWQKILAELDKNQLQLDIRTEQFCDTARQNRIANFCTKGCCNCCNLTVNCSFAEALKVTNCLTADQQQILKSSLPTLQQISLQAEDLKQFLQLFRSQLNGCPLLESATGSCSIYPQRPFACRALISTRNSSWCAVDFAELHPLEKEAFLSSLDPEEVAFPTHYLAAPQELALELESHALAAMREAFGVSLSGNLIYQVGLELDYQLSAIIPQGFVATQTFLEQQGLDLPFLLQLREA